MTETQLTSVQLITEDIMKFRHDPLGYVYYSFPWGVEGTELADKTGPRTWQIELLVYLGQRLEGGADPSEAISAAIQTATASGHGIGKSALVAWIILWGLSTLIDTKIVVTANTDTQLRTKTWPEVAKWHGLAINSDWFDFTATALASNMVDADGKEHRPNWRADAIPWSERNTEAFAGLHNEGKRLILIFDEAAGIPAIIWEVATGALTDADTEIIWCVFGNPTRNDGKFRECFGSEQHRWRTRQIDSRTVDGTNNVLFEQLIEDHGLDSDYVKVRVLGQFPSQSSSQFIGMDVIDGAKYREIAEDKDSALICGIDFARSGTDKTVMRFRRGRDARTYPVFKFREMNSMRLAAQIVDKLNQMNQNPETKIDQTFGDGGGIGGPIIDRLNMLGAKVIEIGFGEKATDPKRFANKRTEMWHDGRAWLATGAIDGDKELYADLHGPEYWDDKLDRLILEPKKDMKARGLNSPDDGDALFLTFAQPVMKSMMGDHWELEDDEIES